MAKTTVPHRNAYILAGFVISGLVIAFFLAFFFPFFWSVDPQSSDISLVFIGTISLVTFGSSIASYFWSLGQLPLRLIRMLSIPNAAWAWFLYVIHPEMGKDPFFIVFGVIIVVFCAFLGTWFGRRFFYE